MERYILISLIFFQKTYILAVKVKNCLSTLATLSTVMTCVFLISYSKLLKDSCTQLVSQNSVRSLRTEPQYYRNASIQPLQVFVQRHSPNVPNHKSIQNVNSSVIHVPPSIEHSTLYKSWSKGVVTPVSPSGHQNCSKLMAGDSAELKQVLNQKNMSYPFMNLYNCTTIIHEFHDNFYVSETEQSFPIAFALVVHTNAQQTLRFLKTIYRPQNLYCIHPDLNSGENFTEIFRLVSDCLPNVFLPSQVHKVNYTSEKTIFKAQMSCFRNLVKYHYKKWYYVINLCSRELPLKTNRYIVESLRLMNRTSVVKPNPIDMYTLTIRFSEVKHLVLLKWKNHPFSNDSFFKWSTNSVEFVERNEDFLYKNGIRLYKSMAYNALSHSFVHYILRNNTMQLLMEWMLKYCRTPEEHFYATAYMMAGAQGGYSSRRLLPKVSIPVVSKSLWKHDKVSNYYVEGETCSGKTVHQVCILTSADLPQIKGAMKWNVWFFNKYFMEDDHVVMDCVEEQLVRANKWEFYHDHHISPQLGPLFYQYPISSF